MGSFNRFKIIAYASVFRRVADMKRTYSPVAK